MAVEFIVRVPVKKFTDTQDPDRMPFPNMTVRRRLTLPCDFVPNTLVLKHFRQGDQILVLDVEIVETRWMEKDGVLVAFAKEKHWHDRSFANAILGMGEFGWEIEPTP